MEEYFDEDFEEYEENGVRITPKANVADLQTVASAYEA